MWDWVASAGGMHGETADRMWVSVADELRSEEVKVSVLLSNFVFSPCDPNAAIY